MQGQEALSLALAEPDAAAGVQDDEDGRYRPTEAATAPEEATGDRSCTDSRQAPCRPSGLRYARQRARVDTHHAGRQAARRRAKRQMVLGRDDRRSHGSDRLRHDTRRGRGHLSLARRDHADPLVDGGDSEDATRRAVTRPTGRGTGQTVPAPCLAHVGRGLTPRQGRQEQCSRAESPSCWPVCSSARLSTRTRARRAGWTRTPASGGPRRRRPSASGRAGRAGSTAANAGGRSPSPSGPPDPGPGRFTASRSSPRPSETGCHSITGGRKWD